MVGTSAKPQLKQNHFELDEDDDLGDCGDDHVPSIGHNALQPEKGYVMKWDD